MKQHWLDKTRQCCGSGSGLQQHCGSGSRLLQCDGSGSGPKVIRIQPCNNMHIMQTVLIKYVFFIMYIVQWITKFPQTDFLQYFPHQKELKLGNFCRIRSRSDQTIVRPGSAARLNSNFRITRKVKKIYNGTMFLILNIYDKWCIVRLKDDW